MEKSHFALRVLPLCLAIFSLTIAGCTTTPSLRESAAQLPANQVGFVAGSYAVGCWEHKVPLLDKEVCTQGFNSVSLFYRRADGSGNDRLESIIGKMFGDDTRYDFSDNRERGYFFCFPLPAGKYSFYGLSYYNFAGGGSGYSMKKEDWFDLPFEVAPGGITDLGALTVTTSEGKNFLGLPVYGPGHLIVGQKRDDGQAHALDRCPNVDRTHVVEADLRGAAGKSPLVRTAAELSQ